MSVRTAGRATPGFCAARFSAGLSKGVRPYCVTFPSAVRRTRKRCSGRVCWTASLFCVPRCPRGGRGNGFLPHRFDGRTLTREIRHSGAAGFAGTPLPACGERPLLCAGACFHPQRERLGYGKGYYDTFLNRIPVCTVGLCYDFQLIEDLPTEAHDKPVSYICTDRGLYRCAQDRKDGLKL